jgi:ParB-like chromosome segregation protein Spo0J
VNLAFFLAHDEFKESDHPRATNGQFGSGGSPKMRDYAPKELDWEYDVEYKKYSRPLFPKAFSSREDFQKKYDAAPTRPLNEQEFRKLGNSMASSGIGKSEDWVHKTFSHRRDSARILKDLKEGETAPPIVLQHGKHLHLMAGQTRLAAGAALGISVPVKVINVGPELAHDDFEESKHPRDDAGKFATGSGGGGKTAQVSSTLTGVFSAAGFKKQKTPGANGTVVYYHPSGAKVSVHPAPEGKKWSSKWSLSHPEKGEHEGEGSALAKLLGVAVKKAETKQAEVSKPAKAMHEFTPIGSNNAARIKDIESKGWEYNSSGLYGKKQLYKGGNAGLIYDIETGKAFVYADFSAAEAELGEKGHTAELTSAQKQQISYATAITFEKGYELVEADGESIIFKNGDAKIKFNGKTEDWIASTPGHVTKEGKGVDKLKALFAGKIEPGVKNSQQVIKTKAEAAAMTEQQKKNAEAQKTAAEEHKKQQAAANANNALYSNLVSKAPQPTATQQSAIAKYSGSGYSQWNSELRHNPNFAKSDKLTEHLDAWLGSTAFDEEVILYRKVGGEYSKILKSIIFEGTKFIDRGYVSTSTHEGKWHGDLKLVIKVPKGSKGAALGKWSHHTTEKEVLLPRDSAFEVTNYDPHSNVVHVTLDQSHFEKG